MCVFRDDDVGSGDGGLDLGNSSAPTGTARATCNDKIVMPCDAEDFIPVRKPTKSFTFTQVIPLSGAHIDHGFPAEWDYSGALRGKPYRPYVS